MRKRVPSEGNAMTKGHFKERCAGTDHEWEAFEQDQHLNVYACKNCLTYARRNDGTMTTIMCAEPRCTSPAEMYTEPEEL